MLVSEKYTKKKNVDKLLRLRIPGIGKHQTILNEQMPTPCGVNYQLSFLIVFRNFADFGIQESKSGCSSYMSFITLSLLAHRLQRF